MKKSNSATDHASKYRSAVAALDAAQKAQHANPYNFRFTDWSPAVEAHNIAAMLAEIELAETVAALNAADTDLNMLRSWLCSALDRVAVRFDGLESAERRAAPVLDAVTADALDAFAAATVARVDPEVLRRDRAAITQEVLGVVAAFEAGKSQLASRRKADGLPTVPSLWDASKLPGSGGGGVPLWAVCQSAASTRAAVAAIRSYVAPGAAETLHRQLRELEGRIADWEARVADERVTGAARFAADERRMGLL
jgi:hypothetical protein